jgi:hypothetical protein
VGWNGLSLHPPLLDQHARLELAAEGHQRLVACLAPAQPTCHDRSGGQGDSTKRRVEMFKQELSAIGLSIEQGTNSVPDDDRYHIVVAGEIVFSSKAKSAALSYYRSLRDEFLQKAGIEPKIPNPEETRRRERQFYDFEAVLSESMRQRTMNAKRKGGKGGSGGV